MGGMIDPICTYWVRLWLLTVDPRLLPLAHDGLDIRLDILGQGIDGMHFQDPIHFPGSLVFKSQPAVLFPQGVRPLVREL